MSLRKQLKNPIAPQRGVVIRDKKTKKQGLFRKIQHDKKKGFGLGIRYSNRFSRADLINAESELGKTLFGPVPDGHQRKFFEVKRNVWLWHETAMSPMGVMSEMTIRYEVRPAGVYKRVNDGKYEKIDGLELNNFRAAAHGYLDLIKTKLYY